MAMRLICNLCYTLLESCQANKADEKKRGTAVLRKRISISREVLRNCTAEILPLKVKENIVKKGKNFVIIKRMDKRLGHLLLEK